MEKGKVELLSYSHTVKGEDDTFEYSVHHTDGETTLEQKVTISATDGLLGPAWNASIELGEFPPQQTPYDAAMKLADWLDRMSKAIRVGKYQPYTLASYQDIKK